MRARAELLLAALHATRRAAEAVASHAGGAVPQEPPAPLPVPQSSVRASPQAWGLAFFFGLQSMAAYIAMGWLPSIFQDAGITPAAAGWLLALTTLVGAPIAILLPELAARRPDHRADRAWLRRHSHLLHAALSG